jgi:cytochrome c556
MKKVLGWAVCGAALIGMLGVAYAQFAKPEDAIEYRQAVMTLMGAHFGRIAAVVKGKKPYAKQDVMQNAELIATLIKLPWDAFLTPGSAKGKTHMRPEVLKEKAAFKAKAENAELEAAKLVQASQTGSLDAVKSQFGAMAQSCKACHDKFRKR